MDVISSLAARVPPGALSTDPADLSARATDAWALALLRSAREGPPPPAAVVFPTSTADVQAVLAWASETGTAIIPRGLGSGVCGAAQAAEGSTVLDLSRMDRVLSLDEVSGAVTVQAGIRGDRLEAELEGSGLTIGHYPQSMGRSTVGGWIAASSAGQASAGYGAIEELLLGTTAVLADATVVRLKPVPRSAAGPDLRRLLIGSEGTLAVITEATLACAPRPERWEWAAYGFPSFGAAIEAVRQAHRAEIGAAMIRVYDEMDAALAFGPLGHGGEPVAIVGFDAAVPGLAGRRARTDEAARSQGGLPANAGYGEHWWAHRNDAVVTYERIMGPERMFGPGVVVDTMEVAALWSMVPALYARVREALTGYAEAVGCHLSHPYRSGASLYFTFLIRARDDAAAEPAYLAAWRDAADACVAAGGTITHHHGVGRLKAPFMVAEMGEGGVQVLRRIKGALDPAGILNRGNLLP